VAVAADLTPVSFSASEVALIFSFLFLWLAVVTLDAIRPPALSLAGSVPIVGGALRSAADGFFGWARGWLYSYLSQSLTAYSNLLLWLDTLWGQLTATLIGFAELSATAAYKITTLVIPGHINAAITFVEGLIYAAELRSGALVAGLASTLAADVAATRAYAAALVGAARTEFTAQFTTAEADAAAQAAHAVSVAEGLFQTAENDLAAEAAQLTARMDSLFAQAQAITAAAEAALRGDLGTVERQLLGDLQNGVTALEREIAAARSAIAAGALGVAAVAADVAAIKALECLRYCAQLADLGSILSLVDLAAIIGLVEFAVHDPQGFQSAWLNDVQPLISGTLADIRSGLGI
jgi:hypothetical protein